MSTSIAKTLTRTRRLLFHSPLATAASVTGEIAPPPPPILPSTFSFSSSASSAPISSSAFIDGSSPADTSPPSDSQENRRGIWSKLLLFVPGAITFGLGTWQIFRRQDKIKMLDYRQRRLELEPMNLTSESPNANLDDLEFRRVVCSGLFDEKRSIFVGPRSRSISGVTTNGYHVITPLMPVPGDPGSLQSPVLVNRGWVPQTWRDNWLKDNKKEENPMNETHPALKDERNSWWRSWLRKSERNEEKAPATASVDVIGVIRGSEKPSIFVPANDPDSGQWFYIDVPAIVRTCSLPENTVYIEDINESVKPSNPYPVPKDANSLIRSSVMPQDHLNYTLTWYALSAAVTFMAFKRIKPKKSRR